MSDQKRVPNMQITVDEGGRPKHHRPNKGRRRHVLSETVTSSVNSARSNDASFRDPMPVRQVLDTSLDQPLVRRSRRIALQNR